MQNNRSLENTLNERILLRQFISGELFKDYFLSRGIKEIDYWNQISNDDVRAFFTKIGEIYGEILDVNSLSEAEVEDLIINQLLEFFQFYYTRQVRTSGRIPDYALYTDRENWQEGQQFTGRDKWQKADCLLEAKAGNINLDSRNPHDPFDQNNPSSKIVSYLEDVWRETNRRVRFAFLTNGREWRIYARETDLRSKKYLSFKLEEFSRWISPEVSTLDRYLETPTTDGDISVSDLMKIMIFFLSADSHRYNEGIERKSLLDIAMAEGKLWERQVTDALKDELFRKVIPLLANGMIQSFGELDSETVNKIYFYSIILLYRLIVVMYAEDRNILPRYGSYNDLSLRELRRDIAQRVDENRTFSSRQYLIYERLKAIFQILDVGDPDLGVIAYNGRLFDDQYYSAFQTLSIPDSEMAQIIDHLSRTTTNSSIPQYLNYAELSVRHLGSIYESLLQFHLKKAETDMAIVEVRTIEVVVPASQLHDEPYVEIIPEGLLYLADEKNERKSTGSYFTPDYIVRFITEETIGPTLTKFRKEFEELREELDSDSEIAIKEKIRTLRRKDPLARMLRFRILDPAVGSGHFLVYAYELLKEWAEEILEENYQIDGQDYIFAPLSSASESEISPLALVERLILKRCLYGIDINPLAVELAKVSLWLSSFSTEYPLSFLDHHLRVGNSLLGIRWSSIQEKYREGLDSYLSDSLSIQSLLGGLLETADLSSRAVRESEEVYSQIQEAIQDLKTISHLHLWTQIHDSRREEGQRNQVSTSISNYATQRSIDTSNELVVEILREAEDDKYFHMDLEFIDLLLSPSGRPRVFDFILTNPPYGGEVASKHKDFLAKKYLKHKDTAALFMSKILTLSKNFGIILPKTLCFYAGWAELRESIFKHSTLRHVMDTGLAFEDVNLETIILIGSRKEEPVEGDVSISVAHPLRSPIPQKTLLPEEAVPYTIINQNQIILFRGLSGDEVEVLNLISQHSLPLGDIISDIFRGVYIPDIIKRDVVGNRVYIEPPLEVLGENHFIWIDRVPHVQRYKIVRFHTVDLSNPQHSTYLNKANRTTVKRLFLKVLRGSRLVSFLDPRGKLCTTGKLVNVIIPEDSPYSLYFLCGIINSPYPSFYIQNVLFSKTTETSRVMDHAYSSLIPVPQINFSAPSEQISRLVNDINTRIESIIQQSEEITDDFPVTFCSWINQLIDNYTPDNADHALHDIIALLVQTIIELNTDIQSKQHDFIHVVSRNYPVNTPFTDQRTREETECKFMEKAGLTDWPQFRRSLLRIYSIQTSEYQELNDIYSEILPQITIHVKIIKVLVAVIEELSRQCFNLEDRHRQIVLDSLS